MIYKLSPSSSSSKEKREKEKEDSKSHVAFHKSTKSYHEKRITYYLAFLWQLVSEYFYICFRH